MTDLIEELVVREIVRCVYELDWAIYEENGKYHISSACLEAQQSIKTKIIELIAYYVEKAGTTSIVGFSEGTDQAVISFAVAVRMKLDLPFFKCMMSEPDALVATPSNLGNSTLLLSYASSAKQVSEIVNLMQIHGVSIRQIVALVDEEGQAETVCKTKGIEFEKMTSLANILNYLQGIANVDKEKIDNILSRLLQDS